MNRVFRTVWNAVRGEVVVVNEACGTGQARGAAGSNARRGGVIAAAGAVLLIPTLLASAVAATTDWGVGDKSALIFGDASYLYQKVSNEETAPDWLKKNKGETEEAWTARIKEQAAFTTAGNSYGSLESGKAASGIFVLKDQTLRLFDADSETIKVDSPIFVSHGDSAASPEIPSLVLGKAGEKQVKVELGDVALSEWSMDTTNLGAHGGLGAGKLYVENADVSIKELLVTGESDLLVDKGSTLTIGDFGIAMFNGALENKGTLNVTGTMKTLTKTDDKGATEDLFALGRLWNTGSMTVDNNTDVRFGIYTGKGAVSDFKGDLTVWGGMLNYQAGRDEEAVEWSKRINPDDGSVTYKDTIEKDGVASLYFAKEAVSKSSLFGSVNRGEFKVGGKYTVGGYWVYGNMDIRRGVLWNDGGTITAGSLDADGQVLNDGVITLTTGGFNVKKWGNLINTGTITAKGDSVVTGLFRNNGGTVSVENITFEQDEKNYDRADRVIFGGTALNGGTFNVTGSVTVNASLENDGLMDGKGTATLTVKAGKDFYNASGSDAAWKGRVLNFQKVVVEGRDADGEGATLWQYQEKGSFETQDMTVAEGGTVIAGSLSNGVFTPGVITVKGTLENAGTLSIDDGIEAGNLTNTGSIGTFMANGQAGTLAVKGTLKNSGAIKLQNVSVGVLDQTGGSLEAQKLTFTGENTLSGGTINAKETVIEKSLTLEGAVEGSLGALSVENGSRLTTSANSLGLDKLTLGGTLDVKSGKTTVDTLSGNKGEVVLNAGSTLSIGKYDASYLNFNLKGGTLELTNGAAIKDSIFTVNEGTQKWGEGVFADGIGSGNSLVVGKDAGAAPDAAGGTFDFGDQAYTGENAVLVNEGGTVVAGTIEASGDKKLTLAGGTLETSFSGFFEGFSSGTITGKDENGNDVVVPVPGSGISSVGSVKDSVKNALELKSGTVRFSGAETGWTQATVTSAASALTTTFTPTGKLNAEFKGTGADGSGVVYNTAFFNGISRPEGVDMLIFSDTTLKAEKGTLTVGGMADDQTAALKKGFGFGLIADASTVTLSDGTSLLIAGYAGADSTDKHLTASQDGNDVVNVGKNAVLTLGNGEARSGAVTTVNVADGTVAVKEKGSFKVGSLTVSGTSTIGAAADGALSIGTLDTTNAASTTFLGENAINKVTNNAFKGDVVNNGSLTLDDKGGSFAFEGALTNNGTLSGFHTFSFKDGSNAGEVKVSTANFTGAFENAKTIDVSKLSVASGAVLTNKGTVSISAGAGEPEVNVEGRLVNSGKTSATKTTIHFSGVGAALENSGVVEAKGLTIDRGAKVSMTDSGTITTTSFIVGESASTFDAQGAQDVDSLFEAKGSTVTTTDAFNVLQGGTAAFSENAVLNAKTEALVAEGGTLTGAGSAKLNASKLTVEGSTSLTDAASLTASDMTVASTGSVVLKGSSSLTADAITIEKAGSLTGDAGTTVTTKTLKTFNDAFTLSGGLTITGDAGIEFVKKDAQGNVVADTSSKIIKVETGKELALGAADFSTNLRRYDVTSGSTVAFGKDAAGLVARMAEKSGTVVAWVKDAQGSAAVSETLKLAAGSGLSVGSVSGSADKAYVNAADKSVTVIDGAVFNNNGVAFESVGAQGTASIASGAKLVLTSLEKEGELTFFKNFDLTGNVKDDAWTGGWTGENAVYVADGSELWNVTTWWDAASGTFMGKAELGDVSTKYDIAISDVANAALRSDLTTGDVKFLKAAIKNTALSIDETNRLVNSVAQIGSTVGAQANFLSDVSGFADTVEARAGWRTGSEDGLWVVAEGGKKKQDKLSLAGGLEAGYDTDAYGFTFGADKRVTSTARVGAAFSYMKGSADAKGDVLSAENDYDTYGLQGYASWDASDAVRVIGEVGYFHTKNSIEQTIARADVKKATADVKSSAFTFGARVEGRFDLSGVYVIPHAGLRGVYAVNDDFTTKIDGEDAFRNEADNTFTAQLPVGVAVEKAFALSSGWSVAPYADVTLMPQFGDTDAKTTVTGVGTGVSNSVSADVAGSFVGKVSLGVSARKDAFGISAGYGLTAGNAGRQDHVFNVTAKYAF